MIFCLIEERKKEQSLLANGVSKMSFMEYRIFLSVLFLSFSVTHKFAAANLPLDEVAALNQIVKRLGATNWNFDANACGDEIRPVERTDPERNITCNCRFENNTCHVIALEIKRFSLPGELPPELVQLPYLETIDFAYNYLIGSIPREWTILPLKFISLMANRLSGSIPSYLVNFTSLTYLSLELNQFSGEIPRELGKLSNLKTLMLSSNNLSGNLPVELAQMKNLTDFRINDNNFSGSIPDFIQSWSQLQRLEMQGSGLTGPIPSSIAVLENLFDLRITDINGTNQAFPDLSRITGLLWIVLRNCNISGEIPLYIWGMNNLRTLDLSFNNLSGELPASIMNPNLLFVFLTHNTLSGNIPSNIRKGIDVDLSYNNFTRQSPSVPSCQLTRDINLNLFRSSSMSNDFGGACMEDLKCNRYWHSLYINCGGHTEKINGIAYEGDQEDVDGAARFYQSNNDWGFSSTGDFLDDNDNKNIASHTRNVSSSNLNPLYSTARLSPLSLTYYRYCLENGSYNVSLHFAEIQFTNEKLYNSLGRRIFDIYIQENLTEKDFNIEKEASGVLKPLTKTYAVSISNGKLEIRFYWAGKGTVRIPTFGVYGSLISAISVNPNFKPRFAGGKKKIAPLVLGIVGSCLLCLALGFLLWRCCFKVKIGRQKELKGVEIQTVSFSLKQIKEATNNFDSVNKIGEGGFGPVHKGLLADGTMIAVKQLSSKSRQGNREFLNEIGMVSCLQHPNLVKLYGCCIQGDQLFLVYEYMENNSLFRALFGPEQHQLTLDWQTRKKICVGIARGLAFLHEESRLKIVHRDIKGTNILLDKDLNPKISDFGLARLGEEEKTHISTKVAGTIGYMAPEYALWGHLTYKADVYSYGVVAMEIISGKHNMSYEPEDNFICLLDWACHLHQSGKLTDLVDEKLGSEFDKVEAERITKVALLCTSAAPALRPTMSEVVSMLEGTSNAQDLIPQTSSYDEDLRFTFIKELKQIRSRSEEASQYHNSTAIKHSFAYANEAFEIEEESDKRFGAWRNHYKQQMESSSEVSNSVQSKTASSPASPHDTYDISVYSR